MMPCSQAITDRASGMDGPTNLSAQCRHRPSSTCLPSMRMSRQSPDSAPWATMRLRALDLPPPGSPPSSMLRSARSTWTWSPFSSRPRWTGPNMDSGNTGTAAVIVVVVMTGGLPSEARQGRGGPAPRGPGAGAPAPRGVEGGAHGGAGRERVAADDVDGHELGPPDVAGDAGVAGVAGGAQLPDVGFEVLGADACAAQDVGAFADLGGAGPQDQRDPAGPGVEAGFVGPPLGPVGGPHAPEPPGDVPARWRDDGQRCGQRGQGDSGPGDGDQRGQPPQSGGERGEDGQFGAPPPRDACGAVVEADEQAVEGVGVVPLVAGPVRSGHGYLRGEVVAGEGAGNWQVSQSQTQASGHAVPQSRQVSAVSVSPSPVSTSALSMQVDPQSGQTGTWAMTRKLTGHPHGECGRR